MTLQAPFVATPLRPHIAEGLAALTERSRTRLTDADKKIGAQLLADAYCDVLDHCFIDLLREIHLSHPSPLLKEAIDSADGAKEKIRYCLDWVVAFFSSERLAPVIAHFNELVHELNLHGQSKSYVVFKIRPELTENATRLLASLRDGTAENVNEGVELLSQVIEESEAPFVLRPKQLMKFNFVVSKALDGLTAVVMAMIKHTLRKLSPQLPREAYPQVATHLRRFLVLTTDNDAFVSAPNK